MVDGCYVLFVFEKARSCILRQLLTFILWIYIPLQVVLFSSFRADEKKQKARHRVKNSPTFLCSGISLKYPSVEKLLSFKLFLLIFGAPELNFV